MRPVVDQEFELEGEGRGGEGKEGRKGRGRKGRVGVISNQ